MALGGGLRKYIHRDGHADGGYKENTVKIDKYSKTANYMGLDGASLLILRKCLLDNSPFSKGIICSAC